MSEGRGSVVLPWVGCISWKMQSILFSGLRGSDHAPMPKTKQVQKWLRAVSQGNADPSKPYMNDVTLPWPPIALDRELEHAPCHFVHHLADALAVVAYNHPESGVRARAFAYHYFIAEEIFHFLPEHPDIFHWRHRDKPGARDPRPRPPFDDRDWARNLLPEDYDA